MKINYIKISNILSFAHYENIDEAPCINFEEGLNIIIGQNGAGKSTALEIINFIFRRIILAQFTINQDIYTRRAAAAPHEIKSILQRNNNNSSFVGFRLEPNWSSQDKEQKIRIELILDDIDARNIEIIRSHQDILQNKAAIYSNESFQQLINLPENPKITFDVTLNRVNNQFSHQFIGEANGTTWNYLTFYNYFRELIELHNFENPSSPIPQLFESFALIGSYRNYHNFTSAVSLSTQSVEQQIVNIKAADYNRSANAAEQAEPTIFSLVRLLIARMHFEKFGDGLLAVDAERLANEQEFLEKINAKLALVDLRAEVKLVDKRTWQYSFSFFDTKRGRTLIDINSLSAGQKAIIHLVFEAYGRGELKGGVVIIDEPEIHLHYQFQSEYLRVLEDINREQNCQYILVTHSESLINSKTIGKVRRFALDKYGNSIIMSPTVADDQRGLVKILDNTRSIHAFFARKVILVEGDSDRYLIRAILHELYPRLNQEIAVLDIGGKGNYRKWRDFFNSFGLEVYYIGDFDNVLTLDFEGGRIIGKAEKDAMEDGIKQDKLDDISERQKHDFAQSFSILDADPDKLIRPKRALWKPVLDQFVNFAKVSNAEIVKKVRETYRNIDEKINEKYAENVFILKAGAIEEYIGGAHSDLNHIVEFCESELGLWILKDEEEPKEIRLIIETIATDHI